MPSHNAGDGIFFLGSGWPNGPAEQPVISLSTAQACLKAWIQADLAVAKGQSYSIEGVDVSRVSADEIRTHINFWQKKIHSIKYGGPRMMRVLPRNL